jgi:hypothetical protein
MNTQSTAERAPTHGNRVVPHSWGGKLFSALTEEDLLSIRDYIVEEASVLGSNHGRRRCANALATNPFHPEFFLSYPFKFWNAVYSQAAKGGEALAHKQPFYEVAYQCPRDVLESAEVPVTLAAISAMKDLNGMYCQAVENLKLPVNSTQLPEWRAAMLWFDFKESDLILAALPAQVVDKPEAMRAFETQRRTTSDGFAIN